MDNKYYLLWIFSLLWSRDITYYPSKSFLLGMSSKTSHSVCFVYNESISSVISSDNVWYNSAFLTGYTSCESMAQAMHLAKCANRCKLDMVFCSSKLSLIWFASVLTREYSLMFRLKTLQKYLRKPLASNEKVR